MGGNAGDLLGPGRVLRLAVGLAAQVGREPVEAHGAAVEELAVIKLLDEQRVAERQDHGGVGVGSDRQPFDVAAVVEVFAGRRHVDEAHTRFAHRIESCLHMVQRGAAGVDLGVLARHAAEGDEELAILCQHVPAGVHGHQLFHRRHDVRHQHARRPQAVGILVADVAADRIQEAMDLALGMMKSAGARPAVRAAEDRAVGMLRLYTRELLRDQIERLAPRQFDERVLATALGMAAGAMLEPALAHGRSAHPQARNFVGQHVQSDRRRIGILGERVQTHGFAVVVVLDLVDSPMGGGKGSLVGHLCLTLPWRWRGTDRRRRTRC